MRYANLYFSRAGNSNWASLLEERRCQSHPGRACVLDGWPRRSTCDELVRCLKLLRLELRLIKFDDDVIKDMSAGLLLRQVSGV